MTRVVAAAAAGRADELPGLYRAALDDGVPPTDLPEATLQVFLFAGFLAGARLRAAAFGFGAAFSAAIISGTGNRPRSQLCGRNRDELRQVSW